MAPCLSSEHRSSSFFYFARPAGRAFFALALLAVLFLRAPNVSAQGPTGAGNALYFDGAGDYVTIADDGSGAIDFGSGDFTVEMWVQRLNTAQRANLFERNSAGTTMAIFFAEDNKLYFDLHQAGFTSAGLASSDAIGTGWTHIACVRQGNTLAIYINGRSNGSVTPAQKHNFDSNASIWLGYNGNINGFWLHGAMDELRIWRVARSQADIQQNMYRTLSAAESGMAAYYRFEGAGADTALSSADGNPSLTGQLAAGFSLSPTPWRTSGAFSGPGNTLHFSGTNTNFISVGNSNLLQPAEYTIEAWIFCNSFSSTTRTILRKGSSEPYQIAFNPATRKVIYSLTNTSSTRKTIESQTSILASRWYHLAASYSVASGGTMKIYVDGVLEATLTSVGTPGVNSDPLMIGGGVFTGSGYFQGMIDEIRIWNRARTATEIQGALAYTLTGSEPNLVAYYRFDQGVAGQTNTNITTLVDSGPNGLHGTLASFTLSGFSSNWIMASSFNTWLGSQSSDWANAFNWSRNTVPAAADTVGVVAGSTYSPVLSASTALRTLTIGSGAALTASGTPSLTLSGHWFNQGTFHPDSSTVLLGGSNQSLGGSTTFYSLTKTAAAADTLTLPAGATQTVTGALTLRGGSPAARLALRSSQPGTQWQLDPQGTRTIANLDVQDSANVHAVPIPATSTGSLDSGNNTGWNFAGLPPTIAQGATASVTLSEDGAPTPFSLALTAADPEGDPLTWSLASPAAHGTAAASGTGASPTLSYTPAPDYFGPDSFVVAVSDKDGTASITVNLTVQAVDDPPVLTVAGTRTFTEGDAPLVIAPDLTLTDTDGPNLTGVKVSIGAYRPGEDYLDYSTTNGVSGAFNPATGVLTLSGSRPVSDYQAALRTVRYRNSSQTPNPTPRPIAFSISQSSLYNPDNEHFYQFVPAAAISWETAKTRAESRASYGQAGYPSGVYGLQGYLATITSVAENQFLTDKVSGSAWIGANDAAVEGQWRWVTGPEAGTQFWQGLGSATGGYPIGGRYTNWNGTGEPNDSGTGGEDYAHMMSWTSPAGQWNDLAEIGGTPGGNYASTGYIVEYGGMPGDPSLHLTGEVTVSVGAVNDAPVFSGDNPQNVTIAEGQSYSFNFSGRFSDADSDPITLSVTTLPAHGAASLPAATLTYTPALDYHGPDSLTVHASDGQGGSVDVVFNFTLTPVNDAPALSATDYALPGIAEDVLDAANPGATVSALLATGAGDVDGDPVGLALVGADQTHGVWQFFDGSAWLPVHQNGAVTAVSALLLPPEGKLRFVPAANFNGAASLAVRGWDQTAGAAYGRADATTNGGTTAFSSAQAAVSVVINSVNDSPAFSGSSPYAVALAEDGSTSENLSDLFSDADGDPLAYALVAGPASGSAILSADSLTGDWILTYIPAPDYHGADSLTIRASDGQDGTLEVSFAITVTPVNDVPATDDVRISLNEDSIFVFDSSDFPFTDVENAALYAVQIRSLPDAGTLFLDANGNGTADAGEAVAVDALILASELGELKFRPAANAFGDPYAAFDFRVSDGTTTSGDYTLTIAVISVNDAPVFSGSAAVNLVEDQSASTNLVALFSDADGDPLSYAILSSPSHGLATLDGATLVYTPVANYHGADSLTVRASDGQDGTLEITFTFTVTPVNDPPTAANGARTISEDGLYTFSAADFAFADIDGDPLHSVEILSLPTAGEFFLDADADDAPDAGEAVAADQVILAADLNRLKFRPAADAHGNPYAAFTFRVGDGALWSDPPNTLTIHVDSVNDLPVISGTPATTVAAEAAYSFTPIASDADGDPLTFAIANQPVWTSFNSATGMLSGTPANSDTGTTGGIVISVSDGVGLTSLPYFDLTVTFTNHPPAAAGAIPAQAAAVGAAFDYTLPLALFTDSDEQALTLSAALAGGHPLPDWLSFDPTTLTFHGSPGASDAGTLFVTVTAADPYGVQAAITFTLTVTTPDNHAPLLAIPVLNQLAGSGDPFAFALPEGTFFDPDGDSLRYYALLAGGQPLPDWLHLDGELGVFSGTPYTPGAWTILLTAYDGRGGSAAITFELIVPGGNSPPYLQKLIPDLAATAGTVFTFSLDPDTFVEIGRDRILYTVTLASGDPLPDWLSFDPENLTFSGTPPAGQPGLLLVRVSVTEQKIEKDLATPSAVEDPASSDLFLIAISDALTVYRPVNVTGLETVFDGSQVRVPAGVLPAHPHYALQIDTTAAAPAVPAGWVSLEHARRVAVVDANGDPVAGAGGVSVCFPLSAGDWVLGNGEARNFTLASAASASDSWRLLETVTDADRRTACATAPFGLVDLLVPVIPDPAPAAALPATGFAPGLLTPLPAQSPEQAYAELGGVWVEIPRLGVEAEIVGVPYQSVSAWDVTWLGARAGWLESTAFPTWAGNSVLAAHATTASGRPGPFARLGELRHGDRIIVRLFGQRYVYEVRSVDLFTDPDDTRAMRHEELPWLTLVTCRGFDEQRGEYRWRTVVRAVQVSIEE